MKLYAFYSLNVGMEANFCVMADSKEQAIELINKYITERWPNGASHLEGWPDAWAMEVKEPGQVTTNWWTDDKELAEG